MKAILTIILMFAGMLFWPSDISARSCGGTEDPCSSLEEAQTNCGLNNCNYYTCSNGMQDTLTRPTPPPESWDDPQPTSPPSCIPEGQYGTRCQHMDCCGNLVCIGQTHPQQPGLQGRCVAPTPTRVPPTPRPTVPDEPASTPRPSMTPTPRPPTPTPTPILPTATPTNSPTPTLSPTPTNSPTPTSTPTPTPVPFSEAMCKCDGIEYTDLYGGQPATITAYGKVEGSDTQWAKIQDISFALFEGDATSALRLQTSGPILSQVLSSSQTFARYSSAWNLTLPQLKPNTSYRIQATLNCQPTNPSLVSAPRVLVAQANNNMTFFDRIFAFFANLFRGGGSSTQDVNPTATPAPAESQQATPSNGPRRNLQLDTIYPVHIEQKTCNLIKFRSAAQ